ncbi:hypothetical protein GMB86_09085 [Terrilactibacillus sp. BCM23-1]|uniref:Murein biosynthesis integral membrane protein MurJ n=1 Tax=Terrilactibacillus tamarindi TaxID=2599694 RepID=A0A6N8CQ51_9BACI|nr:lipid II flippase MurJ [Terrilactibacillus tamarindi]MTT32161.1 hypothetical protein [Terrilactibacillus tamarindi]
MGIKGNAIHQLGLMMLLTILTQFFILIKNSLTASYFGISTELDVFNLTTNFSNFVYSFIGAGVSTILIPYLRSRKNKYSIDIFITTIYTVAIAVLFVLIVFRRQLILLLSGSSDSYFIGIASNIIIFTLLIGFFNSLMVLVQGILNFNDKFNGQKLILLFTTILSVILLIFIASKINIYLYAIIILITCLISVTLHLYIVYKSGFKYKINYDLRDSGFREMLKVFFPTMLSTGVYQVSLIIDSMIASRLGTGSISILNYSNSIIVMINMLFLSNLTSFIYPKLIKKGNELERQRSLFKYIKIINVILCLIVVLFFVGGSEGIRILYERGNFSAEDTHFVFLCTLILAIALPSNGIRDLMYKYFYINKDSFSPFINSIFISILNITLSIIFSKFIGLYGVVVGTVLASYLSLLFIYIKFLKKFSMPIAKKDFNIDILKTIAITTVSIIVSIFIKKELSIDNEYVGIVLFSFMGIFIYTVILVILKSDVFIEFIKILSKRKYKNMIK